MFSKLLGGQRGGKDMYESPHYDRLLQRNSIDSNLKGECDPKLAIDHSELRIQQRSRLSRLISRLGRLLIICLAIWGVFDLARISWKTIQANKTVSCNCGETVSEAISNGCKYDSIAAAWLPDACRDDSLIAEFEKAGPNQDGSWPYYTDRNKTRTLTVREVSMLPNSGGHFFTIHQWHLVHCAYYWKKLWRSSRRSGGGGVVVVEQRYDTMAHIDHCEKMFLKRDPLDNMATEAGVSLHSDRLVVAAKHRDGSRLGHVGKHGRGH
ncbi:hypothetical protein AJ80_09371 [Polytolypa hystricis UAMH7299]|uniref:Uncharacterized protein n=1 Tax=Polytolypa hystricis (strain UAMH7299) TaxID=1447883 RepID=A0A2B7WRJ3_POLH7|nr:hypothetical protein AJ80_09371 [Polytolypa hystricis UAMH7299]